MKAVHNIIAKTSLTADQFVDLMADSKAMDKSMSAVLRDAWLKSRDVKPARTIGKRPNLGQFQAKFAPGRVTRSQLHVRMNN